MVDQINNDITWQAQQGSVAAIIQILNDKLANSGIRTRAIFNNGVLQILCEARIVDNLEQLTLVQQVKEILESLAPRNIRRVNINARIVREEQLLWLEEITRVRENQLLWSEEICLTKPNIIKRVFKEIKENKANDKEVNLLQSSSYFLSSNANNKTNNYGSGNIWGIICLCLFMLTLGGVGYSFISKYKMNPFQLNISNSISPEKTKQVTQLALSSKPSSKISKISKKPTDSFTKAVRIANKASLEGQKAKTSAQWLELAARWQQASDFMGQVPPNHSRYREAQKRIKLYRQYSENAQLEAKSLLSLTIKNEKLGQ
jgi:hypothetical protein